MVNKISGQGVHIPSVLKQASSSEVKTDFMKVLKGQFEKFTGQLEPVTGMPSGVYCFRPNIENLTVSPHTSSEV